MKCRMALLSLLLMAGCSQHNNEGDISYVENARVTPPAPDKLNSAPSAAGDALTTQNWHENQEHGFSVNLPAGWGPIADDALAAQSEAVSGPNLKINYLAGYQVIDNELFVHPYILVRRLPESVMPKEKVSATADLFRESPDKIADLAEQESGLNLNLNFGVPVLEEETGIVWLKAQMDGADGQRVEGLVANYYVDGQIMQFMAGTTVARGKQDWPELERVLRTIRFRDD